MNPVKNESPPSKLRVSAGPILICTSMIFLMFLTGFHEKLPTASLDWLVMVAMACSVCGIAAAWGVRQRLVARAALLAGLLLMIVTVLQFFRR